MKPFYLLSLLAAALVASAQAAQGNNSSDIAIPSVPVDTNPTSASIASTPPTTPGNEQQTSSAPPAQPPPTSAPPPTSQPPPTSTSTPTPTSTSLTVIQSVATNSDGDVVTVQTTATITPSASAPSTSSSTSPASDNSSSSSSSIGKGGIIGLAVAGGVAVLFLIAFFVWKFTSKRKGSFDDNEDIKWPELNAHSGEGDTHPVPVHNTGRSGFDSDLSRVPSAANTFGGASSVDLHGDDPYAVPPLPHLNPNQPYRDDPAAMGPGGYDPYRGPVPQTFNEANGPPPSEWGQTEAIPMTQMSGRMSPGPQAAYASAGRTPSPGPQMAYNGGRASPGPQQMAYSGGRASPGPQQAYGRASPAPQAVYGRASPGPQQAYGGRVSPGPQQAYGGGI